jgi:hypothetical protein
LTLQHIVVPDGGYPSGDHSGHANPTSAYKGSLAKTLRTRARNDSGFFWIYAITKLFVVDIDVHLMSLINPQLLWLLNYKLTILLALIAIAMLVSRSLTLALAVCYITFYPLIVVLWKVPRFVWTQTSWLLALAIVNAVIAFFYSFRRDFIIGTIFIISTVTLLNTSDMYVLYGTAVTSFVIVAFAYYLAFLKAFKPSAVFETYTRLFPAVRTSKLLEVDASLRNLPSESMSEQQVQLRTSSLQNVVLFNRACLFISKKLRDYQKSGVNVVSYIFGLVFLLVFTVVAFSLINYSLFKINPNLYQFTYSQPSFFAFMYYSGGSMFYAANGLVPVAAISQGVQLVQFLCGVLLLVILITVIVALRNEKYAYELERVIASVEREGRAVENVLRNEFNFDSVDAAITALQQTKAGFATFIIYLTNNIGE